MALTSTEDPYIIDFKQEGQPFLINELVLHDERSTKPYLLGPRVYDVTLLLAIDRIAHSYRCV
jgi:hypothetical protein